MKTFAFLFAITISTIACLSDDSGPVEVDNVEAKKGIVDCNNKASKPNCKECGNGGTMTCCPPADQGWECDVLCDNWVPADPRTGKPKSCP